MRWWDDTHLLLSSMFNIANCTRCSVVLYYHSFYLFLSAGNIKTNCLIFWFSIKVNPVAITTLIRSTTAVVPPIAYSAQADGSVLPVGRNQLKLAISASRGRVPFNLCLQGPERVNIILNEPLFHAKSKGNDEKSVNKYKMPTKKRRPRKKQE